MATYSQKKGNGCINKLKTHTQVYFYKDGSFRLFLLSEIPKLSLTYRGNPRGGIA